MGISLSGDLMAITSARGTQLRTDHEKFTPLRRDGVVHVSKVGLGFIFTHAEGRSWRLSDTFG
jgi:hypothetical protein